MRDGQLLGRLALIKVVVLRYRLRDTLVSQRGGHVVTRGDTTRGGEVL